MNRICLGFKYGLSNEISDLSDNNIEGLLNVDM